MIKQWFNVDFLRMPIYIYGNWKLTAISDFPHIKFLAGDTETKLYYNNVNVSDEFAYNLYKEKGQKFVKENLEVKAYAYMLSDGKNLAVAQCCEDFLTLCAMFNVKRVFWYNAKFDFAIFDYFMLTNGWKCSDEEIQEKENYGHLSDKLYQSLNGDFGQRYQLRIWKSYKNHNYKEVVTSFRFVDICNIYGGGLAKNLEDWDIRDDKGNKVRKLAMNYENGNIENDIKYLLNDTKGLYLLAEKIDKTIFELCGLSLFKGDYITAGGLAKKVMLEDMFGQGTQYKNIKLFKKFFPISVEEDLEYRKHKLYLGGRCLVNPYKLGKQQHNIFKYDVNSMYPAQMYNMLYPFGNYEIKQDENYLSNCVYILKIKNFNGFVKKDKIPIWQDTLTGEYPEFFAETDYIYIWKEELDELKKWYYLNYEIMEIREFKGKRPKGMIKFIDRFYNIKKNEKGVKRNGAKLFLNSSYGKYAQRVERVVAEYELKDGYVALVKKGIEIDEKSMLSVVIGSRITALARVTLMQYIRKICNENVLQNFVYCDTDSVHALTEFNECDSKALGKMKNEGTFSSAMYLAPKSYLLYNEETNDYEVHCKGVNTKVVSKEINGKDFRNAIKVFAPNVTFKCLMGLNVKGGKALIYVDKMIVNEKNIIKINKQLGDLENVDID